MTKRAAPKPEGMSRGVFRDAPTCALCGFSGHPTDEATPYICCGGVKAKHQRRPVEVTA